VKGTEAAPYRDRYLLHRAQGVKGLLRHSQTMAYGPEYRYDV